MRDINLLVVHCSDTPDTMEIGAKEIRQWHVAKPPLGNGWADIGYHAVITRSGKIELGRTENTVGAHVANHNAHSLGICWVGRKAMTCRQNETLINQLVDWCKRYKLTAENIKGHCELDPHKTCPNLDMGAVRALVRTVLK